ncbi:MAG: nucleotidyltransferase domain-containing protein [Promethearchaeota archaeon]|nr:MAG: nucleotidyltransferase domain-containing protein [Candidatus Lokiarchaeota archaeon]
MLQNESEQNFSNIEVDLKLIKLFAEKIGEKYSFIISIYLFGSAARGNANKESDIDLFILIKGNPTEKFLTLSNDEDYKNLEDWSFNIVEGGLSPLICNKKELVNDFDTLLNKILKEGIRLYGANFDKILSPVPRKKRKNKSHLLEIVRSL